MYESFFNFSQRPFAAVPRPDFFFPAEAIEHARQTLKRCIERGEGPALVVGGSGTGKSLLCHTLADQLSGNFRVAMLATARLCTRRGLLQNMLFELGLPYRDMEEGELRLSLIDSLDPERCDAPPMLLLVDEAHALPLRLLEEVRMITNLVRHGQPRVRLVLVGGPALEERFAMPRMASFNQRLAARCYLDALGRDETFSYVRFQIERAGGNDAIFAHDALEAAYHASGGVPRLINQVCDHALILACAGGKRRIDSLGIEEAWADLQQLPAPQIEDNSHAPGGETQTVEFGQLDELEDLDGPATSPSSAASTAPAQQQAVEFHVVSPDEQLDDIEEQLASVEQVEELEGAATFEPESSFAPPQPATPPAQPVVRQENVELQFHMAHDPFGEEFAEEEVVIDRYASLETALAGRPRVASRQGRELAALLPQGAPANIEPEMPPAPTAIQPRAVETPRATPAPPVVEPVRSRGWEQLEGTAPPQEQEPAQEEEEWVYSFSGEPKEIELTVPAAQVEAHESQRVRGDDRDLIEVEEELAGGKREDYRQLFSRLRDDA